MTAQQITANIGLMNILSLVCCFAWVNIWNWIFFDETMTEAERVRRRGMRSIVALAINFTLNALMTWALLRG